MKLTGLFTLISVSLGLAACDVEKPARIDSASVAAVTAAPRCFLLPDGSLNAGCLPVTNEQDWQVFLASNDRSRVRSAADWTNCLASSTCNPLAGVDRARVDAFTRSLVFNGGAIAGADFSSLETVLTYAQFARLWSTFGMDINFFTDYIGYRCVGPGDCEDKTSGVCTSNC